MLVRMTYVITDACIDVKDKICLTECPVDCIYEGPRMLYIHPDECIDCGACEEVCPVNAIYYESQLPAEQGHSLSRQAERMAELGSPLGAKRHGPMDSDHPSLDARPVAPPPD